MSESKVLKAILRVEGMSCSHCASAVEKALRKIEGVVGVRVDLTGNKAEVEYLGRDIKDIIDSFNRVGHYKVSLFNNGKEGQYFL